MVTFAEIGVENSIVNALEKMRYTEPSSVQAEAIPQILAGKDLIILAHTGSGKTAACAIPLCQQIDTKTPQIQALVVVPTRELALQYASEAQKIGSEKQVKVFALFGGESSSLQHSKLRHGVHILVATPGRLIDFIYARDINLTNVRTLVLDEADEMLSMGFYDDLEFVMQCLVQKHQTLLFSATMPKEISSLAKKWMSHPEEVVITTTTTPSSIEHHFLYCRHDERSVVLTQQIKELKPKQSLIFCHSRHEVERVKNQLQRQLDAVDYLHAGLSQEMRRSITNKFRNGKIKHLVATDVASRGLDFTGITHVFIYHLGDDPDIYVHRSGRTGRYDKAGMVVTLVTAREINTLKTVLEHIGREPNWIGPPPPERPPRHRHTRPAATHTSRQAGTKTRR